jgi:hypothetical protein
LKNEVKRKMHAVRRAVLHQSHTEINSQEENSSFASSRGSAREVPTVQIHRCGVAHAFITEVARINCRPYRFMELHLFRARRIYN